MQAAYNIFKQDPGQVTLNFEQFNQDFYEMCSSFEEVTHHMFKAGQEVEVLKPVAPVKAFRREPTLMLPKDEAANSSQSHR